ncbi:uncharacterized protein LOC127263079 [Andrographis paniculata]|uniref:uncharacterized protein LOC127263079 n=1 Tax=Andrographis paniculata TaxID=175694 RepID=UPI0021E702D7|nr:uncharacterized protein LOC127263079 [Andrographis paniculata]
MASRGAQSMNSMYFKPMLRKAYHRKTGSPDTVADHTIKLNGDEAAKHNPAAGNGNGNGSGTGNGWWMQDHRTGIYYPKGQEKVMEDVPSGAMKEFQTINWFD